MLLKRLTLVGFKSFADRTRLEFDAAVNVVVGPNGSGKSNVLDAIAWVMGTQATRGLRTEKMEDVVFAGTASRPALNRAEVALTFANDDGFLPIDLAEVTITRRLYRDGTSEYLLNGTPCRLLDIQELLSDGGVGRHQHVLVGQGQIGLILNAKPEEHRAVIEEAAGITKHRSRRDRAVRRLEATAADLDRLHDLLGEKRKQMRPLKRQANAAARHDAVKAAATALQLWLGGERLRSIRGRLEVAQAGLDAREGRLAADGVALADLEAGLGDLRSEAGDVGAALDRDATAAARLETAFERLRRIASVARERGRSLQVLVDGAGERLADLESERSEIAAQITTEQAVVEEARALSERRELALVALEDEERSLGEQAQLPAEGVVANLRGELRSLETAGARDDRELEALANRRRALEILVSGEDAEAGALDAAIRETDGEAAAAQARYDAARTAREQAQTVWESDEELAGEHRLALAAARARVDALETALAGRADPAARELAAAQDDVVGSVASRLAIPPDLVRAVDGVLGVWGEAFVARERATINSVAERLKREGLGGVALLIAPPTTDVPARAVAAAAGLDALVDRLGATADDRLSRALLGDVVVVEGWAVGWRLVTQYPEIRAVTPEGDVITATGMVLSEPAGAGPAAVEAGRVELEIAERDLARVESHRAGSRRSFEGTRSSERTTLEALETLESKLAGHTEALGLVTRSRDERAAEVARLDARSAALTEAAATRISRISDVRTRLADFEGEEAERQAAWESLQERRNEVARSRDDARRLREDAAATFAGATERLDMLRRRDAAIDGEVRQAIAAPAVGARIDVLRSVHERASAAAEAVSAQTNRLRTRQRELREQAGAAGARLTTAEEARNALVDGIAEAKDAIATLSVELAELRVRDEACLETLRREADTDEATALGARRPELDDDADPVERRDALVADLRRMGPINPLAQAEYEEVSAAVELLERELSDLDASRSELRKVIVALDGEMATLFVAAFEEIAGLYEENFALLFPGGRGRLRLHDPNRPLETGVEVEAQPHGKKVGRLSLLSGGERSLAALAFLFAVFRARPSPFYVLDEVEAALDDANLHRFLKLVDTLRASAQLVVITHQQQTMEAADMLYGVTMEPGESSKVIAKRMSPAGV